MTIWERIAAALAAIGIPVAANVLIVASEADRPDQYLVFTLVADTPVQHADNLETIRSYRVQVNGYSRSGLATLPDVNAAMLAAGFMRLPARELPYSKETRHFGIVFEYIYQEVKE